MNIVRLIQAVVLCCAIAVPLVISTSSGPPPQPPPTQVGPVLDAARNAAQVSALDAIDRWRKHFARPTQTRLPEENEPEKPGSPTGSRSIPDAVFSAWRSAQESETDSDLWMRAWQEVALSGIGVDLASTLLLDCSDDPIRAAALDGLVASIQRREYGEPDDAMSGLHGRAMDWVENLTTQGVDPGASLMTLATAEVEDASQAFDWLVRWPVPGEEKAEAAQEAFRRLLHTDREQAESRLAKLEFLPGLPAADKKRLAAELVSAGLPPYSGE